MRCHRMGNRDAVTAIFRYRSSETFSARWLVLCSDTLLMWMTTCTTLWTHGGFRRCNGLLGSGYCRIAMHAGHRLLLSWRFGSWRATVAFWSIICPPALSSWRCPSARCFSCGRMAKGNTRSVLTSDPVRFSHHSVGTHNHARTPGFTW